MPECDILSAPGIKANLPEEIADKISVSVFDSIDSTNNEAKRRIASGLEGEAIFAANEQTAGRGRRGRSFYSPCKSGLYFSVVLRTGLELSDATLITTAAAVVTAETLIEVCGCDPRIKWVNDIFVDGKKVCGILTEAVSDFESGGVQAVVVGIGINLNTESFPEEIENTAGNAAAGKQLIRNELAAKIFIGLKSLCEKLPDRSYMSRYRELSNVIGKDVTFERSGAVIHARALDITEDGGLLCRTPEGEEILRSGEVSVNLN